MSYILDALKKADAQRERDPARGIHAQPLHAAHANHAREGSAPWLWGALVVGGAALAWAGWFLYTDKGSAVPPAPSRADLAPAVPSRVMLAAAPAPAPVVGTAVQPPAPPAPVVPVAPRDVRMISQPTLRGGPQPTPAVPGAPATPEAAQAPGAVPGTLPPPVAAPGAAFTVPAAASASASAVIPGTAPAAATVPAPVPSPAPVPVMPRTAANSASAAAAAAPPAAPVAGLPADAPKLAISGGVYSTNAAQRMLIVNGQVFNEGSEIGTGVVLEQIRPKGAILRFRGARYTVAY
ncbi:MAG: general secretion pathway protein GspB [Ramlibacter sp.]|nr:general secretion pathway protein GspB [Ramlibacter sp.]